MIVESLRERTARLNYVRNTVIILKSLISIISANIRDSRRSSKSLVCNDDQGPIQVMPAKSPLSQVSSHTISLQVTEEMVDGELAQLEYGNARHQHILSFSNDKTVVIVDGDDDYVLCKDVVQDVYNIINTIMLFLKVGMDDRTNS